MSRASWFRLLLLLALAAGVVAVFFLPLREEVGPFLEWLRGRGPLGPLLVVGLYLPACVLWVRGLLLALTT